MSELFDNQNEPAGAAPEGETKAFPPTFPPESFPPAVPSGDDPTFPGQMPAGDLPSPQAAGRPSDQFRPPAVDPNRPQDEAEQQEGAAQNGAAAEGADATHHHSSPAAALIPFFDEPTALPTVYLDRSTIERYTVCPYQGWAVETGQVLSGGFEADSGSEVHRVVAEAVGTWLRGQDSPRDYMNAEVLHTRADVQPDCLKALRPSIYSINEFLRERNPADVRAYQGGEGEQNGQFAVELLPATADRGVVIATSEIDLLLSGTSKYELHEIDWKSGFKPWTSDDVKAAFQFRMHAWLIFGTFPDLEQLHVTVWTTRFNRRTPRVTFTRRAAQNFQGCIEMAWRAREKVFAYAAQHNADEPWPDDFTWPDEVKCDLCPATRLCPRVHEAFADLLKLDDDPVQWVQNIMVLEAALAKRKAVACAYVRDHGEIVGGGVAFGTKAPKKTRTVYKAYTPAENDNDDSEGKTE